MNSPAFRRLGVVSTISLALGALAFGTVAAIRATEETGTITLHDEPTGTPWTYDGHEGPEHWDQLDPAWTVCGSGIAQSPIDIVAASTVSGNFPDLQFNYHTTPLSILNNGHTIEVEYHTGSSLSMGGNTWELRQFHFHAPSEHTFEEGAHFDAELHAVHRDANGQLAVVGLMIKKGAENPALPSEFRLRQALPRGEETEVEFATLTVNLADLLPADRRFFMYRGSLTTPPCSEIVSWFVLPSPIEMSPGQLSALKEALGGVHAASREGATNRPTQPLHGRTVYWDNL